MKTNNEFACRLCNQWISHEISAGGGITGYGTLYNPVTESYDENDKICFSCCAVLDKRDMLIDGNSKKLPLYLNKEKEGNWLVSNWAGTLHFPVKACWTRKHNWWHVGDVTYFRFIGPDRKVWSGKCVGDSTEIAHCRRTKLSSCYV